MPWPRSVPFAFALAVLSIGRASAQPDGQDATPRHTRVIASTSLPGAVAPDASTGVLPIVPPAAPRTGALGDQAPQCRSACAATRYSCLAQDSEGPDCDARWNRCVIGCTVAGAAVP